MKNITPELIERAREAKSSEELVEIAKSNGIELSESEARIHFEQLHANEAVSDDELDLIAGGCGPDGEKEEYTPINITQCPSCKATISRRAANCPSCKRRLRVL